MLTHFELIIQPCLTASRYDLRFSGVLFPVVGRGREAGSIRTEGEEVTEGENLIGEVGGVAT